MKMILDEKEIVTVHYNEGDTMIHVQEYNKLVSAHRLRPYCIVEILPNGSGREVNQWCLDNNCPGEPDHKDYLSENEFIYMTHTDELNADWNAWRESESKLRQLPVTSKDIGAYISRGGSWDVWVSAEVNSTWYAFIRTVDDINIKAFELVARTQEVGA